MFLTDAQHNAEILIPRDPMGCVHYRKLDCPAWDATPYRAEELATLPPGRVLDIIREWWDLMEPRRAA